MLFGRTAPISAPSSSGSRDEPNKKEWAKNPLFSFLGSPPAQTVEIKIRVTELLRRIEDIVAPTVVGMGFTEAALPLTAVSKAKLEMTDALIEEHRLAQQGAGKSH